MPDSSPALLHFDSPGPDRTVPVGRSRIKGWMVPSPGWHFTDLRLRHGEGLIPGIYGFPRQDVAEYLKSREANLPAGFEIPVDLPAGRHQLILEACAIAGAWETLATLDVEAVPGGIIDPLSDVVPLRAREFGEALRIVLRRLGEGDASVSNVAAAVAASTPSPHYLRHPHRPFRGHLDEPQAWSRAVFGRIAVSGWLFHEAQAISRVFATTDLQAVQNLRIGRPTPFLGRLYPQSSQALACGFDGFIDLPAQLPSPVTVRVYAELADGTWHLGSVARIATTDHEFAKQPLARFSPLTFWRAWRALRRELSAHGLIVETGHAYRQEIRQAWRDYRAQAPRRSASPATQPPRPATLPAEIISHVHYLTHNLGHEGAPLFLLEHARMLVRETGARLTVTSGCEGPLRAAFTALGATVQVVDATPLLDATSPTDLEQTLANLAAQVDLSSANLVIANTLSAYWGVLLAHRAQRPVLYYIHESTPPRSFFRGQLPAAALAAVESSFQRANCVSFLTATSRRYFTPFSDHANYCLHPGWIDLTRIGEFRRTHSREIERARLGLAADKKLVLNLGTVCDRKGQHLFARAVDLLWRLAPAAAARAEFLMVGGRDTAYDRELAGLLLALNRPNLRVVPETGEAYPYYFAADLFVCSSYEESFPRVILEAMAFGLPIVSTAVHGIPEMARPDHEALLVSPGDSAALATAMRRVLESPVIGQVLAQQAQARVAAEFDSQIVLPRHLALARSLAKP